MNKETLDKARLMVASGYNMNQVASILMVDKVALMNALNGNSGLTPEKPKKSTKVVDEPLFPEEPGL